MSRDLPSLNAIRMFEAAARHRNFTRAAEELFVTQGAVSRQIRQLESDLEQDLFRREGPRVELTQAGERLYRATEEALGILRRSTLELRRLAADPTLTISVLPSFAAKWLVPRLGRFQSENAEIDLRLAASYDAVDFSRRPDIDLAIRFGQGPWPGLYNECLINEQMFPVCSPSFLARQTSLSTPEDMTQQALLYSSETYDQWRDWFAAADVSRPDHERGPRYGDELMLLQAAIEGQGIALARSLIASDEIGAGRLVRLFDITVQCRHSYYFVCPEGRESKAEIRSFLDWLRREALATDAACKSLPGRNCCPA